MNPRLAIRSLGGNKSIVRAAALAIVTAPRHSLVRLAQPEPEIDLDVEWPQEPLPIHPQASLLSAAALGEFERGGWEPWDPHAEYAYNKGIIQARSSDKVLFRNGFVVAAKHVSTWGEFRVPAYEVVAYKPKPKPPTTPVISFFIAFPSL